MLHILLSVLTDAEDHLFYIFVFMLQCLIILNALVYLQRFMVPGFSKAFRLPLFLSVLGPAKLCVKSLYEFK